MGPARENEKMQEGGACWRASTAQASAESWQLSSDSAVVGAPQPFPRLLQTRITLCNVTYLLGCWSIENLLVLEPDLPEQHRLIGSLWVNANHLQRKLRDAPTTPFPDENWKIVDQTQKSKSKMTATSETKFKQAEIRTSDLPWPHPIVP